MVVFVAIVDRYVFFGFVYLSVFPWLACGDFPWVCSWVGFSLVLFICGISFGLSMWWFSWSLLAGRFCFGLFICLPLVCLCDD